VLANFYSETTSPKRVLHYRGQAMSEEGDSGEAERLYLAALEIDVNSGYPDDETTGKRERERDGRTRDILIRLDLTRMYLDEGRTGEATGQLDEARRLHRGPERFHHRLDMLLLESRILIRNGAYEESFDRLKRLRPLIQPRSSFESYQSYEMYLQFHSRRSAISEALAMYALTAKLTGRPDELDWARTMAADRGCDLKMLR
jgi:tetratricopeptide (TPR) repeat protein